MAVAPDATGTLVTGTVSPVNSASSITVGASATDMWIVVQCDDATATLSAPTWNGVAATLIGTVVTSDNTCRTSLYGLVSPASGAKSLSVSWSGGAPNIQMIALSVTGGVTSSVAAAFTGFVSLANNTANSGGTVTVTTGASGDMSVAACNANNASSVTLTATSSTSIYSTAGAFVGAASRAPGAASVAWTSTISGLTVTNTIAGCNIVAAAAGDVLMAQILT